MIGISSLPIDPNTYSNYKQLSTEHVHIEWLLDLDYRFINATAQYQFKTLVKTDQITLDVYQLDIRFVYLPNGKILKHSVELKDSLIQGDQLVITLDRQYEVGEPVLLSIKYSLDERARALGFLRRDQTYSGLVPYVFSQCETNNCRSMIPLQDTPSSKFKFSASIITKDPRIKVFVTGEQVKTNSIPLLDQDVDAGFTIYQFKLDIPIPAYLIGIVAGDVEARKIDEAGRTWVISEPHYLDEYSQELSEVPTFLTKMEEYIGPYVWGTYKIVILPPSFPFGGMEHPLLTFASPVIIVGDKSGVGTAVHEIAHSWLGNMVTGKDWSNMWIMEGFCVFLERKILSVVRSKDYALIEAINGNAKLQSSIDGFTKAHELSYQSLHPNTSNKNPDDATSSVPYEKGFQLLTYIESLMGEEHFQSLLKDYVNKFKYTSIDEDDFYRFLISWIKGNAQLNNRQAIQVEIERVYKPWVLERGMPQIKQTYDTPKYTEAIDLAAAWVTSQGVPANHQAFDQFLPNQKQVMLQYFVDHYQELTHERLLLIDETYKLTNSKVGPKIVFQWYKTTLLCKYEGSLDGVHNFVSTIGVRSYVIGTYSLLILNFNQQAHDWYEENKNFYHPLVSNRVKQMLEENKAEQLQ